MKALSIRQPWAWLIVNGHKDIENRTWPTRMRGEILVHASAGMTRSEYDDVVDFIDSDMLNVQLPPREALERGGIVGKATIYNYVTAYDSPWFFDPQGFLLRDASILPFMPFKGTLNFFDVPDELIT